MSTVEECIEVIKGLGLILFSKWLFMEINDRVLKLVFMGTVLKKVKKWLFPSIQDKEIGVLHSHIGSFN